MFTPNDMNLLSYSTDLVLLFTKAVAITATDTDCNIYIHKYSYIFLKKEPHYFYLPQLGLTYVTALVFPTLERSRNGTLFAELTTYKRYVSVFSYIIKARFLPYFSRKLFTTILNFGATNSTTTFMEARLGLTHKRPSYRPTGTHPSLRSVLV